MISKWTNEEKEYLKKFVSKDDQQVTLNHHLGFQLYSFAKHPTIKSILEIGTFYGRGSTKCIVQGLKDRTNDDCVFYSLEANTERCDKAKELYRDTPNVHILNEVIFNTKPEDQEQFFPILHTKQQPKSWNDEDLANIKDKKIFLNRKELPNTFDLIFLDGGEYTTWFEYNILKDKCRYLMLDDIDVDKCYLIVEDLKQNNHWRILLEDNHERNGFLIAEKIMSELSLE